MAVWKLTIFGRLFNQVVNNTFHYRMTQTGTSDEGRALITAFSSGPIAGGLSMYYRYRGCLTTDMTIESARVVELVPPGFNPRFREALFTVDTSGTQVPPTLPPQIATVISRRGDLAKRYNYGRIYLTAVPQAQVNNAVINTAGPYAAALDLLRNGMLAAITGNDGVGTNITFSPVLVRRGQFVGMEPVFTPITSGFVDVIVRDQRRRQLGVGA